ncbi:MAG: hypothetical protein V1781_04445 [Bacteroidota bacterium]
MRIDYLPACADGRQVVSVVIEQSRNKAELLITCSERSRTIELGSSKNTNKRTSSSAISG